MTVPPTYLERVYAGVLGKIIGVYLGRPFEGWTYERISAELGEINTYVHQRLGKPLIVTDDDISGTFTFLRALADYGYPSDLTPAQIGQTWLNYIIEERTILWWGGMGNSTEHTAYLRLKNGVSAPQSGAIALNGQVVAEQIGAQIFIDGWAMVAPGDPARAADLARRAGSVSHDGEAIYGAQVIAAMEALAFVESDLNTLLDEAVALIPRDSIIYRMIADIRHWHAGQPDWRQTRQQIAARYGYDKYGGNCHIVPNHGLIIHALLHGDDDFRRSLMIVNTCGWDTDCNSGNVGCLLGIKNGLAAIDSTPDLRRPVADRLYLPTADGGRAITDAVTETFQVVNAGRALQDLPPLAPKNGARFHFELPGSVQGFQIHDQPAGANQARLENVAGHSTLGARSLAIYNPAGPTRVGRATFIPPEAVDMPGYGLLACPTLYPGQTVRAGLSVDPQADTPLQVNLFVRAYGPDDEPLLTRGPALALNPGQDGELRLPLQTPGNTPIFEVGLEIDGAGTVYLDYLTWDGRPNLVLDRPTGGGTMWRRAWIDALDSFHSGVEAYRLIQNEGTGLLIQGTREWSDYHLSAEITPHLVEAGGIAVCVQGQERYYALLLERDGYLRLVKQLDGRTVLAEVPFEWGFGRAYNLALQVSGARLQGTIDGQPLFDLIDDERPLRSGAVALVCRTGRLATEAVTVRPAD